MFIINNGGYASIRNTQRNYFDGRHMGTGPEAGLFIPSFVEVAKAMGLPSMEIKDRMSLRAGISNALSINGPLLCEIYTTRFEALLPKAMALPQSDGSMLSMPLEDMSPLLPRDVLRREMLVPLVAESETVEV
jgi:acetolactate synthase-1/2/3 large subunit